MTAAYPSESDFADAVKYWQLERLYIDLAAAKGRGLTPLEKKFLQGLLCGYSPIEISARVYRGRSSSAVRVYLSNGLYKYLHELLIRRTGQAEKIKNWSRVTKLLEQAGYRKDTFAAISVDAAYGDRKSSSPFSAAVPQNNRNWEERIDINHFLGREEELSRLKRWILGDRCRIVALLGMGGSGKTALAVKLAEQIQGEFEFVIWRSLRDAPSPESLIADLLQSFSQTSAKLSDLMAILRSRRCLLVFNQFESVLAAGKQAGVYAEGYQLYGELLRRLAEESHLSCCVLTSREKPQELAILEGKDVGIRSLYLSGLNPEMALHLLTLQGLIGSESEQQFFVSIYANNPLIIKLASLTINNIFNRNLTEFLATKRILFNTLRQLLDEQFNRLSDLEKRVMYALVVNQKLAELWGVGSEITFELTPQEQLNALESLQRRSLIQPNSSRLAQPLLLKTYILEKLVEQVEAEMNNKDIARLVKHLLRETLLNRGD